MAFSFWSIFEYSVSESTTIPVSCDVLWSLVRDFERYPTFLSAVTAIERIDDNSSGTTSRHKEETKSSHTPHIRPGTRFRRTLVVGNQQHQTIESIVTVIQCDDHDNIGEGDNADEDSYPRTFSIYADNFTHRMSGRISWTVHRQEDDNASSTCQLTISSTILPKRCCLFLGGCAILPVCCFPRVSAAVVRRDLDDFAHAAVRAAAAAAASAASATTTTTESTDKNAHGDKGTTDAGRDKEEAEK